jgi:hypothetical protein
MSEVGTQICVECGEPTARSRGDSHFCKECGSRPYCDECFAIHGGEHFAEAHAGHGADPENGSLDP